MMIMCTCSSSSRSILVLIGLFLVLLLKSSNGRSTEVAAGVSSSLKVLGNPVDDEISSCKRDMDHLLSFKNVFNHPDLKDVTTSALKSSDNTNFELICQALGGQMITQEMVVSCDNDASGISSTIKPTVIIHRNAPNCVPKSCNLSTTKKSLSMTYATNFEDHLNQINIAASQGVGKCHVRPDFCESDTFHLLGTWNIFEHSDLKQGLGHAFNSCMPVSSYRSVTMKDCHMNSTTFFEEQCEQLGGQMITHHIELSCRSYGKIQFFNSPNCVAKSCDASRYDNWETLTLLYTKSLQNAIQSQTVFDDYVYSDTWSFLGFNGRRKDSPGFCTVSIQKAEYPSKLLLPSNSTMEELLPPPENSIAQQHSTENSSRDHVVFSTVMLISTILVVGILLFWILPHRDGAGHSNAADRLKSTLQRTFQNTIVARPFSRTTRVQKTRSQHLGDEEQSSDDQEVVFLHDDELVVRQQEEERREAREEAREII